MLVLVFMGKNDKTIEPSRMSGANGTVPYQTTRGGAESYRIIACFVCYCCSHVLYHAFPIVLLSPVTLVFCPIYTCLVSVFAFLSDA